MSFHFTSQLYRPQAPRISLGNSISLRQGVWLNVSGDKSNGEPTIVIEDGCAIGTYSVISAIVKQGITEGGRIRIGRGSYIGHGASIICPRGELTIGRNCVVAANSVVTRSIPDYSVVFGSPATIIRQYDPETKTWRIGGKRA